MASRGMHSAKSTPGSMPLIGTFKQMFFDRVIVETKAEAAILKVQSRFGAYVWTRARRSMKRRKKGAGSAPGSPPYARLGLMRDRLFFGYDAATKTVVVGPEGLGNRPGEVPAVHEFGGVLPPGSMPLIIAYSKLSTAERLRIIYKANRKKMRLRAYLRDHSADHPEIEAHRSYERRYPKRPYMKPALDAELPKFAGLFRGEVK
jgi:hypothetical protein